MQSGSGTTIRQNLVHVEPHLMSHALSCKKDGFITLRHNEVRDITADGRAAGKGLCGREEPALAELNNEQLPQQANTSKEAHLDISVLDEWSTGIFRCKSIQPLCPETANEKEEKKQYGERVMQVENEIFTPFVFAANGEIGKECVRFYKRLSEMIAEKSKVTTSLVSNNIRTAISFSLVRSMIRCIRGSRNRRNPSVVNNIDNNDQPVNI